LAVILAEMDGSPREMVTSILLIGAVIVPLAALEAVFALTIESVLNMVIFERFAGLVILAIAAKTASSKIGELLPSPGIIIVLGLVASLQPNGLVVDLLIDPELIARASATAAIGVGFALLVALTAPQLRGNVDIDRFRFGSSVALGVLALPILGLLETDAPIALAVLLVAALFAYNPDADPASADAVFDDRDGSAGGQTVDGSDGSAESVDGVDPIGSGSESATVSAVDDGPRGQSPESAVMNAKMDRADPDEEITIEGGDVGYGYPSEDSSQAPWL
jgi:hypothetical protein